MEPKSNDKEQANLEPDFGPVYSRLYAIQKALTDAKTRQEAAIPIVNLYNEGISELVRLCADIAVACLDDTPSFTVLEMKKDLTAFLARLNQKPTPNQPTLSIPPESKKSFEKIIAGQFETPELLKEAILKIGLKASSDHGFLQLDITKLGRQIRDLQYEYNVLFNQLPQAGVQILQDVDVPKTYSMF